jgi:hypothetical protein
MSVDKMSAGVDRREFFKAAGAGLAAAVVTPSQRVGGFEERSPSMRDAPSQSLDEKNKFDRIASCSYPIRYIFKTRPRPAGAAGSGGGDGSQLAEELKKKYGEITMLDFPQFTKDTFPGVTHMDIFSGLFGDVTDDSMYVDGQFEPSTPSGRKWLDKLVAKMAAPGPKCSTSRTTPRTIWRTRTQRFERQGSRSASAGSTRRQFSAPSPCA